MSKLVDKLSTEEMINEVKKCRLLWDSTLDAYQNKILRMKAWRTIMAQLIPEMHSMTTAEQAEIEHAIRRRWKSIRTCYSRELLKQKNDEPGISGRKQYQYFDQLRFLDLVPKNESVNEEESENHVPSPKPAPATVSVPVQKPLKRLVSLKKKAEKNINEKPAKKRAVQYRNLELENEADRMFLLSLVPDLQKVPPGTKLQLKSDILNSILRAQQQDPLSGTQLYVTEDNLNLTNSLNSTGGKLYNNFMFHKNLRELQQDGQEDDIYVPPSTLGMEFIKMETAESVSSLEDRGSLVGSEDCDDIFLA